MHSPFDLQQQGGFWRAQQSILHTHITTQGSRCFMQRPIPLLLACRAVIISKVMHLPDFSSLSPPEQAGKLPCSTVTRLPWKNTFPSGPYFNKIKRLRETYYELPRWILAACFYICPHCMTCWDWWCLDITCDACTQNSVHRTRKKWAKTLNK